MNHLTTFNFRFCLGKYYTKNKAIDIFICNINHCNSNSTSLGLMKVMGSLNFLLD